MPASLPLIYRDRFPSLRIILLLSLSLLFLITLGCNLPKATEQPLSQTKIALDVQATIIALQTQESEQATPVDFSAQATKLAKEAQQKTDQAASPTPEQPTATLTPTQTDTPTPTNTSLPTDTPMPTIAVLTDTPSPTIPVPTDTPLPTIPSPTLTPLPSPTSQVASPTPDMTELMKTAKILLFEDITGLYLDRYVKAALDMMGLTYVDVKDAIGTFKEQLLSGTDWDLVITSIESRSGVQGEYFDYLNDQLTRGTSVILEIWNLDDLAGGRISNILVRCGIKFENDWWDPPNNARSVWWLVPEHPIFHEPNEGMSLGHYSLYWFGDAGDLIKLSPGSKATLLAGTLAWEKQSHGTLATCLGGRFIIQTFSTHDYYKEDMVLLWQNYIYYALKNHFFPQP